MAPVGQTQLPRGISGLDYSDKDLGVVAGANIESTNTYVASAGGVFAGAPPLVAANNIILPGGGNNGSVALPAPEEIGVCKVVFNISGFPINVFASGTDTINGLAAGAAVSQMNNSIVYYTCTQQVANGVFQWLAVGLGTGYAASGNGSFPTYSSMDNLAPVALATQATAALVSTSTVGVTPAAATDGVRLPPAKSGMEVTVINKAAATALTVFPASQAQGGIAGGDSFNNQAANSALTGGVPAATILLFYSLSDGVWWSK